MNKDDFRREVAENFIKLLETDGLSWAKGWSSSTESPMNGASSKFYRGMNAFNLFMTMKMNNWEDPRFFTVKQANSLDREDGQDGSPRIIKGERACHVEYWFVYDKAAENPSDRWITFSDARRLLESGERSFADLQVRSKHYAVFNVAQIDGLVAKIPERASNESIERDDLIEQISNNLGVAIKYDDGDRCYYSPNEDSITLPEPRFFLTKEDYQATALHELTHSTGHSSRLDRLSSTMFGSPEYAYEELVAEMGSVFLTGELFGDGISDEYYEKNMENHAAYVKGWISAIKDDPDVLFKAIKEAENACDYIEVAAGLMSSEEYQNKYENDRNDDRLLNNDSSTEQSFDLSISV